GISRDAPVWTCTVRNTWDNVEFLASMVSSPFWYVTRGGVGGICGISAAGAGVCAGDFPDQRHNPVASNKANPKLCRRRTIICSTAKRRCRFPIPAAVYIGISVLAPNSPALYTHRGIPAHIYFLWPGPGLEIPFDAQWGEFERERMRRGQPKKVLPVGKLPLEHLRSLLRHLPKHDPRLLIGPQIGEDAAVIDAGDRYLVVTTDPITFATDHIGRYAVHVNANDIAVL